MENSIKLVLNETSVKYLDDYYGDESYENLPKDWYNIAGLKNISVDDYYKINNCKDEYLHKIGKLDDNDFDFEDYYEYSFSQNFDIKSYEIHKIKPYLFFSNRITWKIALIIYEHIFLSQLQVLNWEIIGDRLIISYYTDDFNNYELLNELLLLNQRDMKKCFIDIIKEESYSKYIKNAFLENLEDTNIDYAYIEKHIRKSLTRVKKDTL